MMGGISAASLIWLTMKVTGRRLQAGVGTLSIAAKAVPVPLTFVYRGDAAVS